MPGSCPVVRRSVPDMLSGIAGFVRGRLGRAAGMAVGCAGYRDCRKSGRRPLFGGGRRIGCGTLFSDAFRPMCEIYAVRALFGPSDAWFCKKMGLPIARVCKIIYFCIEDIRYIVTYFKPLIANLMKKIVSLVAAACALAFVACDKPTESEPTLTVGSTSLTFEAVGSPAQNVGVTSNVEWKCTVAESAAAWLTAVKTDSGDGITVSVTDNGPEQRVGKITVEAVSAKVKAKEITVTQKAGEAVAVEFTLTPDKLEFVGESAPAQEVTVVLDGEGMTWKAAPEADGTWAHVEAGDGKFTVTVDDNPSTSPRATRIVVTPSDESVAAKSVTVTQNGKEIKPSLSVTMDPLECSFRYNDISVYRCNVEAVLTDWTAGTSDGAGNLVPWINLTVVNNDDEAYIGIGVDANDEPGAPERTGYVVITPTAEELEPITITVKQGGPTLSTLTGPVEITDMTNVICNVDFFPNTPEADGGDTRLSATWDMYIWGTGLEYDTSGWPYVYRGSGNRLKLSVYSTKIPHNDDNEYYLPDGEYTVVRNSDNQPNTITYGQDNLGVVDPIFPMGSWYFDTQNDAAVAQAPLAGGKMTVQRNGEVYTLTFDFTDDAGNAITGTCTATFNMTVTYNPPEPPLGGGGEDDGGVV